MQALSLSLSLSPLSFIFILGHEEGKREREREWPNRQQVNIVCKIYNHKHSRKKGERSDGDWGLQRKLLLLLLLLLLAHPKKEKKKNPGHKVSLHGSFYDLSLSLSLSLFPQELVIGAAPCLFSLQLEACALKLFSSLKL